MMISLPTDSMWGYMMAKHTPEARRVNTIHTRLNFLKLPAHVGLYRLSRAPIATGIIKDAKNKKINYFD